MFVTETVVGWNLNWLWFSWLGVLNLTKIEELVVFLLIEILGELIDTSDSENSSECFNATFWFEFIAGPIVITDEVLAWLIDCEALWELLSLEEK